MLNVLIIAAALAPAFALWRIAQGLLAAWRRLPRSNEDLVFF